MVTNVESVSGAALGVMAAPGAIAHIKSGRGKVCKADRLFTDRPSRRIGG